MKEVKRRYPNQTILGSGDVFTAEDAVQMLRETGVDIVWIARGAIGNPWIFGHVKELLAGADPSSIHPPTLAEQKEALVEHFAIAMQIHGESLAGRRMRKIGIKYSRFHPQSASVKADFIAVQSLRDWSAVIDRWYAADGPGQWPDSRAADEVNDSAESVRRDILPRPGRRGPTLAVPLSSGGGRGGRRCSPDTCPMLQHSQFL